MGYDRKLIFTTKRATLNLRSTFFFWGKIYAPSEKARPLNEAPRRKSVSRRVPRLGNVFSERRFSLKPGFFHSVAVLPSALPLPRAATQRRPAGGRTHPVLRRKIADPGLNSRPPGRTHTCFNRSDIASIKASRLGLAAMKSGAMPWAFSVSEVCSPMLPTSGALASGASQSALPCA